MALTHLVDTSVLTRLRHPQVAEVLRPLLSTGSLARASITDLEIGYSARNEEEWLELAEALGVFSTVQATDAHVRRALQVQRLLAARSQRGRKIPDLLVAAAAEQLALVVLHYDADFERIALVTGQQSEWVLPPGTVP